MKILSGSNGILIRRAYEKNLIKGQNAMSFIWKYIQPSYITWLIGRTYVEHL